MRKPFVLFSALIAGLVFFAVFSQLVGWEATAASRYIEELNPLTGNQGQNNDPPVVNEDGASASGLTDKSTDTKDGDSQAGKDDQEESPCVSGDTPAEPASSDFKIDVSISDQKLRIYQGDKLIKEWVVSTGKNSSTPLGEFEIQNRGKWFFSEKYKEGAKWWVSFKDWGTYLFHSVPMDKKGNIIVSESEKLGCPASHGCVRLQAEHAKWIYDNISQGTPVNIH